MMSREDFDERKAVAEALLELPIENVPLFVREWAMKHAYKADIPNAKPATTRTPVLDALAKAPKMGMRAADIAEQTGIDLPLVSQTLSVLLRQAKVCRLWVRGTSWWYSNLDRFAAGREAFDLEPEKKAAPKEPEPAPPVVQQSALPTADSPAIQMAAPKRRASPQKHQALTVKKPAAPPPVRKPKIEESIFIPPHVKVQELPSGKDTRYTVTEPITGGFHEEWQRLRAAPKD